MAQTWSDVFDAAVAKGCDHASAATRANDWERRRAKIAPASMPWKPIPLAGEFRELRECDVLVGRSRDGALRIGHVDGYGRLPSHLIMAGFDCWAPRPAVPQHVVSETGVLPAKED